MGEPEYLPYDVYQPFLEQFNLYYIPPLCKVTNGDYEKFAEWLEKNTFLIKDDCGVGEGIVIKNYSYSNKYGRSTWAKIVRNEFKDQNRRIFSPNRLICEMVEENIVDNFCTDVFIEKEFSKIKNSDGWSSKFIPRLFGTIYHELVTEEIWHIIKKYKDPKINFRTLKHLIIDKIKNLKPELFS